MLVTLRHKTVHVGNLFSHHHHYHQNTSVKIPPVHQHLVEDFPLEPQHPP